MKLPFKKLSFKMKVKLGVLVVFIFVIALVIHEDHAGVVLRKFKPKRALVGKKEANATTATETDHKPQAKISSIGNNESIIEKYGKNETTEKLLNSSVIYYNATAEKLKANSELLLNSSVIYYDATNETAEKLKTNSEVLLNSSVVYYHKTNETDIDSKAKVSIKDFNRNIIKSNLKVKDENQNLSTQQASKISLPLNETLLNSSELQKTSHPDIKSNHQILETDISNSSESHVQKKQRSLEFDIDGMITNNSAEALLNISNSSSLMLTNSKTKEFQKSPNNSKNVLPDEKTKKETIWVKKEKNTFVQPNDNKNVSFIPEKILGSDLSPRSSKTEIDQKMNSISDQLNDKRNVSSNLPGKPSDVSPIAASIDKALNKTEEKLVDLLKQNDQKVDLSNKIDIPDSDDLIKTNETILNQTAMGLESIVSAGLDFLANSEVAKNAALAMEIFNLSDSSITDHIVDDPDSVIELVRPSIQEETKDSSTMKVEEEIKDSSTMKVEEEIKDSSMMKVEEEIKDSSVMKIEEEIKNSSVTGIDEEIKNSSMIEVQEEIKDSSISNESSVEHDINLVDKKEKKCPPPGICVFWFMTRNTCNTDDQCLDSKICCRIRCSKQCIAV